MFDALLNGITYTIQHNPYLAFGAVFLGGVLTASNPCVLVMVPLSIAFVGGHGKQASVKKSFLLSLMLVLGLALTFTILGVVAILSGRMLGDVGSFWPYIIAAVCLVMGLQTLGVFSFNIPLPQRLQPKQKGLVGAFLLGMLFGVVSSPCAVPILAVILTIIAAKGSFVYGAVLLWLYALGHCALILIAGTSIGVAKVLTEHKGLNRATNVLRKVAGVLIILVGLYFLFESF